MFTLVKDAAEGTRYDFYRARCYDFSKLRGNGLGRIGRVVISSSLGVDFAWAPHIVMLRAS